jgi:hypothetical protein
LKGALMSPELTPCEKLRQRIETLPGDTAELYLSDGVSLTNNNILMSESDELLVWEGNYG